MTIPTIAGRTWPNRDVFMHVNTSHTILTGNPDHSYRSRFHFVTNLTEVHMRPEMRGLSTDPCIRVAIPPKVVTRMGGRSTLEGNAMSVRIG